MIEAAELKSPNMLGEIKINDGEIVQEIVFTDKEVIVLGIPRDEEDLLEDDRHNCDFLGCGQCHVLHRFRLTQLQKDWTPISEGLPEQEGWWLVTLDWRAAGKRFTHRVYFRDGEWDLSDVVQRPVEAIAWRPLPPAYEGEGK